MGAALHLVIATSVNTGINIVVVDCFCPIQRRHSIVVHVLDVYCTPSVVSRPLRVLFKGEGRPQYLSWSVDPRDFLPGGEKVKGRSF